MSALTNAKHVRFVIKKLDGTTFNSNGSDYLEYISVCGIKYNSLKNGIDNPISCSIGAIDYSTGIDKVDALSFRTPYIPVDVIDKLYVIRSTNLKYVVRFYTKDKTYLTKSANVDSSNFSGSVNGGWLVSGGEFNSKIISSDIKYVRFVFRKLDDSSISQSDINGYLGVGGEYYSLTP